MPALVTLASDTFAVAQSADVDELQHHAKNAACVDCLSAAHPAVCILQGGCLPRGTVCVQLMILGLLLHVSAGRM